METEKTANAAHIDLVECYEAVRQMLNIHENDKNVGKGFFRRRCRICL